VNEFDIDLMNKPVLEIAVLAVKNAETPLNSNLVLDDI
jgi:hypothetical protein